MKTHQIKALTICCLFSVLGNAQNIDTTSQLNSWELIEKAEHSLLVNKPQEAIEYIEKHVEALNNDNEFNCGNGAALLYIHRLTLLSKAYCQMEKYELAIDTLLPLAFDQSITSLISGDKSIIDLYAILIQSIRKEYKPSEIKNELEDCVKNINFIKLENIETHTIKIFDRELNLYLLGIHEMQYHTNKVWSNFYNNEYEKLSKEEAAIRLKEINSKLEAYFYNLYDHLCQS